MSAPLPAPPDRLTTGLDARLRLRGGPLPPSRWLRVPASVGRSAAMVVVAFLLLGVVLLAVPWQQAASGTGRVLAWAPEDRQQTIDAPVDGRVAEWFVAEGDPVVAGQPLVRLVDNDPDYVLRLGQQRESLLAGRVAASEQVISYRAKLTAAEAARGYVLAEYDARISGAERERIGEIAAFEVAKIQEERLRTLHGEGITSARDHELATATLAKTRATVEKIDRELTAYRQAKEKAGQDADAKIAEARADLDAARGKEAEADQKLASIDTSIARQETQLIVSPADGWVVHLDGGAGGGQVKKGDSLVSLLPDTASRAVELWIDGNDMPLVHEGTPVRVLFEGWPALQMVGLPGMHRGTFGGEVGFVSPVDNGKGKFRVLVVPTAAEPWPDASILRQGVQAKGWALLGRVPLGYEMWRRFNGFPIQLDEVEKGVKPVLPSQKKPRTPAELK